MVQKVAIVTGGNKGIGWETCLQLAKLGFHVVLTSRDPSKGEPKAEELRKQGLKVDYYQLDVSDSNSIEAFYQKFIKEIGRVDVLINNAAILLDKEQPSHTSEQLRQTLETNVIGPYHLITLFAPIMQKQKEGRIVNVSSGVGQLSGSYEGLDTYAISKTALNAVTHLFANKMKGEDILVNSVCPGWVKTDMGGSEAPRSLTEGAFGIVWAATLPKGGPSGGFFRDGKPLTW